MWGAIALGLGSIVLAVSTSFALSLVAMFISGAGAIAMAVTANTTIQMAVPDQLRGRVMSVYTTVFAGSTPIGGLTMGFIAARFGVAEAFAVRVQEIVRQYRQGREVDPATASPAELLSTFLAAPHPFLPATCGNRIDR